METCLQLGAVLRAAVLLAFGLILHMGAVWAQSGALQNNVALARPFAEQAYALALPELDAGTKAARLGVRQAAADNPGVRTLAMDSGLSRDVPVAAKTVVGPQLSWRVVGGSRVAQVLLRSPGAVALRVAMRLQAGAGVTVRFAGSGRTAAVYGEAGDRYQQGSPAWSPVTEGDTVVVELHAPLNTDLVNLTLTLERVAHLDAWLGATSAATATSASGCDLDTACQAFLVDRANLRKTLDATAKILVTKSNGKSASCSGTLINSATRTGIRYPYFLTAHHCLVGDDGNIATSTPENMFVTWFFEANECGQRLGTARTRSQVGAKLLYADAQTDTAFLVLTSAPPEGAQFADFDAQDFRTPQAALSMHHARGEVKRLYIGMTQRVSNLTGRSFPTPHHPDVSTIELTATSRYPVIGGASGAGVFSLSDGGTPLLHSVISAAQAPLACGAKGGQALFAAPLSRVFPHIRRYLIEFAEP